MGGKGGGKAENAQASGSNIANKDEIISKAQHFAEEKLGIAEKEKVSVSPGAILHCPSDSRAKLQAMITAVYSGKTLSIVDNRKTYFRAGTVELINSTAITYHLASPAMRGRDPLAEAQILQWISYADNHIQPSVACWVHHALGTAAVHFSHSTVTQVLNVLKYLNTSLLPLTYLVGERISLADIVVFTSILPAYIHVLDPETKRPFINVNRWFNTILHQPQISKVVGSVQLCLAPPKIKKPSGKKSSK